jgi:L-lactate dehydrogenase complex protein LldF
MMRLLPRSATGQSISNYFSILTGTKKPDETDGPEHLYFVLVDNGRADVVGSEFNDMLRCIRCGACMNHCPVYQSIGGHAYGWVYPGPMGAVLTPKRVGVDQAGDLPNASTFCGRCEAVCPMRIPLPKMMRYWREAEYERKDAPAAYRYGLGCWAFVAKRPRLYALAARLGAGVLGRIGRGRGRFAALPLAKGWTAGRDLPAPEGATFRALWRGGQGKEAA